MDHSLMNKNFDKPKILTITAPSGAGKSLCATYLEINYNIPMIESHTDRPRRTPDEKGHTFWTPQEFNQFKEEDMIAYTKFGDYRYCCVKDDVKDINTYVIDETGIDYLKANFSDIYDITSLFVDRDLQIRKQYIDADRLKRDEGMYYHDRSFYDFVIDNNGDLASLYKSLDDIVKRWLK